MNEEMKIPCPHCRNEVILGASVCTGCQANISYLKVWTPEYSAKYVKLCKICRILGLIYLALVVIYECGAESPKNALAKISKFQTHRQFFKIYTHEYKNIRFFSKKRLR